MKNSSLWIAIGVLLAALVAGGLHGQHIDTLREARAFYEWMRVAGTSERMFTGESVSLDFVDEEIYNEANQIAAATVPAPAVSVGSETGGIIASLASNDANNDTIWAFAKSDEAADVRAKFLVAARANKLQFAQNVEYANAEAENVSILNLLLGFRKVAANFLWIEADRAWSEGHIHRLIPMLKTVVTLDPQFIDAYLIGAWHLAYNASAKYSDTAPALRKWNSEFEVCIGQKELYYYQGADLLKQGIRHNPRDYRLYFDLGFGIYNEKIKDYEKAVLYLREAVKQPHERWVPRMLYLALTENGQYQEALDGWKEYEQKFPDSASDTPERFIQRNTALLHEQKAEKLKIDAASAPEAEAATMRAEADKHLAQAREIWGSMNEDYAQARLLRLDAIADREMGRYIEANAKLMHARQLSGSLFKELSDLIIEIKQEAGEPLAVTEQKQVIRESVQGCEGMPEEFRNP